MLERLCPLVQGKQAAFEIKYNINNKLRLAPVSVPSPELEYMPAVVESRELGVEKVTRLAYSIIFSGNPLWMKFTPRTAGKCELRIYFLNLGEDDDIVDEFGISHTYREAGHKNVRYYYKEFRVMTPNQVIRASATTSLALVPGLVYFILNWLKPF